ncbi:bifunctional folylpolyglutamate synthase/dihydrofolate synthase [Hymenobacter taeanensis]|uniref:Dihydrofolate synthase/folylpolyglutamate synthase n=1 Tax=Hymenobacter taeanensis TaxID=2735321 RepID=A0A6M6BKI3_9BACT|nr:MULTISPECIES: folylpolyglutamate synthase/dihydrofolate synthase family protein [Hymenobacter]QJX48616.1 bifunctional folylpolyglutamate synthase/dihydrofolate synthase [Hymenobacter taeanensis]UOQ81885.1 bifunctional folylpolyglutamate synthase/dihydrofolate synthase [Hymenobacter sp. 5414T-23]
MTYRETLDFLYNQLPMFQRVGEAGYKPGLGNTEALAELTGHPERTFPSVHVAGTNGKGSSSNLLAAVLQAAGYTVGLYTSPHLREFTERIKVNGEDLKPEYLVDWVARWWPQFQHVQPSFFEMCVALCFCYFAEQKVDIAVIEVGLGGRLDSTNIIRPLVSLITNISFDHQNLLGDTLPKIAGEKAGIIKSEVPAVISQTQPQVRSVFEEKAAAMHAPLQFADQEYHVEPIRPAAPDEDVQHLRVTRQGAPYLDNLELALAGDYQRLNLPGVLATIEALRQQGYTIPEEAVRTGLRDLRRLTGFRGRWTILSRQPLVVCDTGHNEAGLRFVTEQLARLPYQRLHFVLGVVNDKDVTKMLDLLPRDASYYFCQASIPRALPGAELAERAAAVGLHGQVYGPVAAAVAAARAAAGPDDVVFIGGSTFVVADIEEL